MPINRVNSRYLVGIDPDIDKNGLFAYDRIDKRFFGEQYSMLALVTVMLAMFPKDDTQLIIEAGWLNEGNFHLAGYPQGFDKWPLANKLAYVGAQMARVGENFGAGKVLVLYMTELGYTVEQRPPLSKKWDAERFKHEFKLEYGYNETIRDAGRIMRPFL